MEKVLYLMRGEHTDFSCTEQENAQSRQCYKICTELTCEIARKTRKIFYFHDGVNESGAQLYNNIVRELVASEDKQGLFEKAAKKLNEIGMPEVSEQFEMFSQLLMHGIEVRYMRTEDDFDIMEMLKQAQARGEISARSLLQALLYTDTGGEPELLINHEEIGSFLLKYRDTNIFNNVAEQADDVSVLFVGLDHSLSEFDNREHSLTIYPVRTEWSDDAVRMEGFLPESYKRFIASLQQKHNLTTSMTWVPE